ncbi:unnamed protein product, partial [Cuscuta campestris]
MSQESTHGQYVPEPEHVSVHTVNTEGSSFTPPGEGGKQQNQPEPAGHPPAVPPPVVPPPVMPPLAIPQVAYEQMFPAMMAHYMQHMAQLMPMFQPPPPPQPQPRIVTFKTLKDNGAKEFRGDKMGEPQIALDWLEQMDRVRPWDRFDRAFTKEYVPTRYREERRDEFVALKQEGISLPELRQKFDYLSQYATSLVSTLEDRLNEFVKKLRPDLRPYAALITTTDFNAAYDLIGISGGIARQTLAASLFFLELRISLPHHIQHGVSSLQQQIISRDHVRSSSTLSYICVGMPANSVIVRSDLEIPTVVSNPLGHSMRLHHIYHRCPLSVQGKQFPADLIELPHKEFDIILGIDWLTEHRAVVDCSCWTVRLRAEDGSDVSLSGEVFPKAPEFISSLSARCLICKKCEMFLCHVQDMRKESPRQQDIRTVCDFPDVFPEDLPGLPPPREVEFSINLIP